VYYQSQSPGGAWSGWIGLGGGAQSLSAIRDGSGNMDVFIVGTNNAVYYQSQSPGGAWGGWAGLDGVNVTSISTSLDANGNLDVFADYSVYVTATAVVRPVYYRSQSPGGAWSGWNNLGGDVLAVSSARDANGNLGVFVIGTDNAVDYQLQKPTGAWSGWMGLGGGAQFLSAICDNGGNLGIFIVGTNNAVYYREAAAYSPVIGTLFNDNPSSASYGKPSYLDVQQGSLGDCWLLASLAEVAAREPAVIQSMFTYEGNSLVNGSVVATYSVRFYMNVGSSLVAEYVNVDTQLPPRGLYDSPLTAVNGSNKPVLWVALAEKAYVEANAAGFVTSNHVGINDYDALGGGGPEWALQAITGKSANTFSINPSDVASAWNAGQLIVLSTSSPISSYIVGSHAYAVVGYDPSSYLPFEVFNPWGTDGSGYSSVTGGLYNSYSMGDGWAPGNSGKVYGLFWANAAFLSQNFDSQSVGGAAPGEQMDRHARGSHELTDLAFIADLLDPHAKARGSIGVSPTSAVSAN
jgi:hypothetical protein